MMQVAKKKSMALTTILAFLIMGVGHIYLGRVKRGFVIFVIGIVGDIIISAMGYLVEPQGPTGQLTSDPMIFGIFFGLVIAILVFFGWQIVDARKECRKYNSSIT